MVNKRGTLEAVTYFIFWGSKSVYSMISAMKLKDT